MSLLIFLKKFPGWNTTFCLPLGELLHPELFMDFLQELTCSNLHRKFREDLCQKENSTYIQDAQRPPGDSRQQYIKSMSSEREKFI